MSALQKTLYRQLTAQPLPEAAKADPLLALEMLKKAAKDVSVLLVLDEYRRRASNPRQAAQH